MNRKFLVPTLLFLCFSSLVFSQVPVNTAIQILKAEDARAYDKPLEDLMDAPNAAVRTRAVLAAGRIGNDVAIPALVSLLEKDGSEDVRAMAAFALGEIESIKAADSILKALAETRAVASVPSDFGFSILDFGFKTPVATAPGSDLVRARLVEAAGKIAAANPKDEKSKALGEAVLDTLEAEERKGAKQSREVVLLGLTAALRAKPEETDFIVAKFLTNLDPRIRADAANTLSRIRAKTANEALRTMLLSDPDPIARANAARALGAAEDKEAFSILLEAATEDDDSRVRVSTIRSLAALKDAKAADKLLSRGEILLTTYKQSKFVFPTEKNELLEISTTLGRVLANTGNERAVAFLTDYARTDNALSPEISIARLRTSQARGSGKFPELVHWRQYSTMAQLVGELANFEPVSDEGKKLKSAAPDVIRPLVKSYAGLLSVENRHAIMAAPDVLRAFAQFKTVDLPQVLSSYLLNDNVFMRATAAELLGEQPSSKENTDALKAAFAKSLQTDKHDNDAQLAILSALVKLNKNEAVESLKLALNATDFLVRRHAADLIRQNDLAKDFPGFEGKIGPVRKYDPKNGTKLGQVLNTEADYKRAVSRKSAKAILTTEKGTFTIDLLPQDATLTVDNFIKLAKSNYFNGLEVHRVVPNFVMQDGDPRGDGNGGPGWSIRCEINMIPYERGAVGMALSGKDTGGSQWFVTHSPQPHLDGGYTVFGRVNETGMKVVDNIVRGDKILKVRIIETVKPPRR